MSYTNDAAALDALRESYPLGTLDTETPAGRQWKRRMTESENYFTRYSKNWSDNRALLVDFAKLFDAFQTYVAIAYPIIDNFVKDMYFRNPNPYVQAKNGDRDLSKILSDVARSVHAECDTEHEIKDLLQDQSWAGFGMFGASFQQKPMNAGDPIMIAAPDTGEPMDSGEIVEPTEQKVVIRRVSPWRVRFDPKGRRWDLSDHRYIAFDTFEYLGPLLRSLSAAEDRARLMAYYGTRGAAAFSVEDPEEGEASVTGQVELDPEFIRVCTRTIWSRPDHMIYKMPFGASFTFAPQPWDQEWERIDEFPVHFAGRNRIPEDKKNTEGFIPLPDIELIAPHIRNINKAQSLLVHELGKVIDVYTTVKGALDDISIGTVASFDRLSKVIQFDPAALQKFPSVMQQEGRLQLKDVLQMIPTGEVKDIQHMAFIDHEFSLIQQIMGQGPADRGGVADSATATQSLGQQQGLARRMSANRNDAGRVYNAVTRKIFIILQARQTLPMRYQMTTKFNEKTWGTFTNPRETLMNVDLHFEYATGSEEPRTREQEFSLRERFAQIVMPIFQAQQNWRMVLKVARDLAEPLDLLFTDGYFDDEANGIVMQLLTLLRGLGTGSIGGQPLTADNEAVAQQIPELVSQLAAAVLTPQQIAEVEATVQGVPPPEGGTGVGSLPSAPSAGEASAQAGAQGSAAAGMVGGLASAGVAK